MSDIPNINLAAIEARATQREARTLIVKQEVANARFTEEVEQQGFNPLAAGREAARRESFKTLENRRKPPDETSVKKVEGATQKEEDLAQKYQQRNPELDANKLRQLREQMRPNQTVDETIELIQDETFFPDPTLADEAFEYLEKETQGPLNDTIRQAKNLLNEQKGREIIAGRNIDEMAKLFHKKGLGSSTTELRNLYRDITGHPRDHNALFSELSAKYPFDKLKTVITFLFKSLAFDLKSKGPSIQQAELMRLMTDTRNLQSILWVYFFFRSRMKLIRSLYKKYGLLFEDEFSFEDMAKEFMSIVEERYPSILKLLKHAEKLGLNDDLEKVIVLSQFRDAVKQLSPRLYKSPRHRQELFSMILETLNDLENKLDELAEE